MHAVRVHDGLFVVPRLDFFDGRFRERGAVLQQVVRGFERLADEFLVGNPVEPAEYPCAALLVSFEVARTARLQVKFGDFKAVFGC